MRVPSCTAVMVAEERTAAMFGDGIATSAREAVDVILSTGRPLIVFFVKGNLGGTCYYSPVDPKIIASPGG